MTDITDEQRAAWRRLLGYSLNIDDDLEAIAPLLPSELTNPQPVLPTKPGYYRGDVDTVWMLRNTGYWYRFGDLENRVELDEVQSFAPFTPLVRERPQITREQVIAVFDSYGDDYDIETVDDLVELANGTDRD